ncbi:amidase [Yinghuangia aomiensis]|uniref:Amidase n=1 Tax=Yinghuangia aomiensis TaxID=676205 RepID=A0ABP9HUB4_9ACTN
MSDPTWLDACAQAELVRSGRMSAREMVESAIDRVVATHSVLNAVIHQRFEAARAEAAGVLPDGPFRGVPIVVKDLYCDSAGDPAHNGARFLKEARWRAGHDSAVVRRLREAGFVIIGRTNVPEFGANASTEPLAYGPTRNPWNVGRSPGGSSGGSAAAVAAGLVPVAHANDGGGSLRMPASMCGLVGLKPTRARVSQAPAGAAWGIGATADGVLSRSVRDTAALLDVLSGPEPGDPYAAPALARPLAAEVGADPGRLRIGLLDRPPVDGIPPDPEAARAVVETGLLLARLGHHVEHSHPEAMSAPDFSERFFRLTAVSLAAELAEWEKRLGRPIGDDELEAPNDQLAPLGRAMSAVQYAETVEWMYAFQRRMARWWADDGFDVLVSPVLNGTPPPLGWFADPQHGRARVRAVHQFTAQFNATGQPALSLPLHRTADGLPVGVQFVAAYGREDLLVRLGAQLEQAVPWAGLRPALDVTVHGG